MKHVRATNISAITGIRIKELRRVAAPGEEFDVSDMRYDVLAGKNRYHKVFVTLVNDIESKTQIHEEDIQDEVQEDADVQEDQEDEPAKKPSRKRK